MTLRDTSLVYKLIGYYQSATTFYLTEYQPVYVHDGTSWVLLEKGGGEEHEEKIYGEIHYTTQDLFLGSDTTNIF